MIKKLKTIIFSVLAMATMMAPAVMVTSPVYATAHVQSSLCTGADKITVSPNATGGSCDATGQTQQISKLLQDVVNIFSAIVGVIAVIMIIVGGLRYITSGGDSSKVASAKTTLIYAIIGLIIVALAQVIVRFVVGKSVSTFS